MWCMCNLDLSLPGRLNAKAMWYPLRTITYLERHDTVHVYLAWNIIIEM